MSTVAKGRATNEIGIIRPSERWIKPDNPAWPTESKWRELAEMMPGRLFRPKSLSDAIAGDLNLLSNPYFIGEQASGTQMSGWLGAWSPKESYYVVAARSADDVARSIEFAKKYNIRLVVKGGGHSLLGASNASDSLLIWTKSLSHIDIVRSFVPQAAPRDTPPVEAVTFGAGCMLMDIYAAVTTENGRFVQGGECTTVGFAGLIANGGFGNFSKNFGTAASHLIEAEIVTADGRIRVINAYKDPDLLWALKGGGGGAFGVVTSMTLKTHDLAHEFGAAGGVIQAGSTKAMRRLVEYFIQFYRDNLYNSHWGGSVSINGNRLEIAMYCLDVTERELRWTWLLFSDLIRNCDQDYTVVEEIRAGCRSARSWWDFAAHRESGVQGVAVDDRPGARGTDGWWEADREQVGAFVIGCDSVWLSEHLLTDKILLAEKLVASAAIFRVDLHFGMGLGGGSCAARTGSRNTATNPAMLNAFALAVVGKSGKPRYPGFDQRPGWSAEGVEDAQRIREAMDVLRQIAPNGGSYISLSDYYNDDWVLKYWGSNAGRLSQIKAMYDPDDLFSVHHGIIGQRSHEA